MARHPSFSSFAVVVAACLALATLFAGPFHADKQPASTRHLVVEVAYGHEVGPESFRESLQRDLIRAIRQERCYATVNAYDAEADAPADLLLRMIVEDIDDRTEYETSQAQRDVDRRRPNMPNEKQAVVMHLEAEIDLRLLTLPDRLVVRSRDYRERGSFRPSYVEDARYEAKQRVLETLARTGRSFVCKGTGKKLTKEIERARELAD